MDNIVDSLFSEETIKWIKAYKRRGAVLSYSLFYATSAFMLMFEKPVEMFVEFNKVVDV